MYQNLHFSGPDHGVGPAMIDDHGVETSPGVLRGIGVFHPDHVNEENRSGNGVAAETGTDHPTDTTGGAEADLDTGNINVLIIIVRLLFLTKSYFPHKLMPLKF